MVGSHRNMQAVGSRLPRQGAFLGERRRQRLGLRRRCQDRDSLQDRTPLLRVLRIAAARLQVLLPLIAA